MKKRLLALALTLAMGVSLAACAPKTATPPPATGTPATGAPATGAPAGEPVTIKWWAFPTFGVDSGYEAEVAAAFMAANPDVKVEVTTIDFTAGPDQLTAAITAGTAPDVLFDAPARIAEYGNAGNLVALDDMIGALKSDLASESLLQTCMGADGTYYMYPISSSPFYMGLNKEALEAADALQYVNLEGDRTWTTENFIAMCEALAATAPTQVPGIVYCGGQGGDQGTRGLVNNLYSSSIVGADGKWNIDEKGVQALSLLQTMEKEGYMSVATDMAAADELQKFQQQTAAMTFCWGTSNAKSYATEDFTQISVPFPSEDGKPELEYLVNGFCVFDNKDAARADASKRLVQFICDDATWGPASVKQTGAFPVRASYGNLYEGDENMSLLSSWSQYYGPYYNTRAGFAAMRPLWFNMLQQVLTGNDVQTAVDAFNTGANAG